MLHISFQRAPAEGPPRYSYELRFLCSISFEFFIVYIDSCKTISGLLVFLYLYIYSFQRAPAEVRSEAAYERREDPRRLITNDNYR